MTTFIWPRGGTDALVRLLSVRPWWRKEQRWFSRLVFPSFFLFWVCLQYSLGSRRELVWSEHRFSFSALLFASAAVYVMQPEPKGQEGGQVGLRVPSAHMHPVHESAISAGQRPFGTCQSPWWRAFVHADRCALCEETMSPQTRTSALQI